MRILGEPEKDGLEEPRQDGSLGEGRGGGRRMFFVAILIVLALFGYLYFFTDMIRIHEEPQREVELLVRKPLPRKGGPMGAMSTSVKTVVAGTTQPKVATEPAKSPQKIETKNPQPGTQKPPATTVAPKPSPEPPQKQVPAARPTGGAAVTPPVAPPPVKTPPATTVPTKPAPSAVATVAKPQPQKTAPSPPPPEKPVAKPVAMPAPTAGEGRFTIQCGPYVSTRELGYARESLKKAGLNPVPSPGPKQPTSMFRLFVAGYSDAANASAERTKLLKVTPDAFVLPHDGNYELFAGSYHEEGRATKALDLLSAKGYKAEIQQVTIPVATRQYLAGAFPTREAAGAMAERLKKDGIVCIVTQRGH